MFFNKSPFKSFFYSYLAALGFFTHHTSNLKLRRDRISKSRRQPNPAWVLIASSCESIGDGWARMQRSSVDGWWSVCLWICFIYTRYYIYMYLYTHLCCLCILCKKDGMAIWAIHMKACTDSCKCGKIKTCISIKILGKMNNITRNNEDFQKLTCRCPWPKLWVVPSVHWTRPWRCRWSPWVWEAPCWSL